MSVSDVSPDRSGRGRRERGAVLVLGTVVVSVLLGLVALVINLLAANIRERHLQDRADAASLAGAVQLRFDLPAGAPEKKEGWKTAKSAAFELLVLNGVVPASCMKGAGCTLSKPAPPAVCKPPGVTQSADPGWCATRIETRDHTVTINRGVHVRTGPSSAEFFAVDDDDSPTVVTCPPGAEGPCKGGGTRDPWDAADAVRVTIVERSVPGLVNRLVGVAPVTDVDRKAFASGRAP